jgi:HlyD family secretion protein
MKKSILITIIILIAVVSIYFVFFNSSSSDYSFRFDKVSTGDITVYVTATGSLNAVNTVQVGTQVSGTISKLYADYNSVVKAGDVIARIDTTFLFQAVRDAEAALEKTQAQLDQDKRNYDRVKVLYDKNLDSQVDLDAAQTAYQTDKASLVSSQANLDKAKINLDYATIRAPIDGVVIDRQVSVGQTVAASLASPTLFVIANDLKKMQVEATVDESDIGRVSVGQTATFTVDAYADENFKGIVSQIRLNPVVISNVVNYTVVINVLNNDLKLMPGMTANVNILVAKKENVLRVPNIALRFQPPTDLVDSSYIYKMRERFSKLRSAMDSSSNKQNISSSDINNLNSQANSKNKVQKKADVSGQLTQKQKLSNDEFTTFGLSQIYPQYEKSSSTLTDEFSRGRVWIKEPNGKLQPLFVRIGLNDGSYSEVASKQLKEGEEIVIGATSDGNEATTQQSNPFLNNNNSGGGRRMIMR